MNVPKKTTSLARSDHKPYCVAPFITKIGKKGPKQEAFGGHLNFKFPPNDLGIPTVGRRLATSQQQVRRIQGKKLQVTF